MIKLFQPAQLRCGTRMDMTPSCAPFGTGASVVVMTTGRNQAGGSGLGGLVRHMPRGTEFRFVWTILCLRGVLPGLLLVALVLHGAIGAGSARSSQTQSSADLGGTRWSTIIFSPGLLDLGTPAGGSLECQSIDPTLECGKGTFFVARTVSRVVRFSFTEKISTVNMHTQLAFWKLSGTKNQITQLAFHKCDFFVEQMFLPSGGPQRKTKTKTCVNNCHPEVSRTAYIEALGGPGSDFFLLDSAGLSRQGFLRHIKVMLNVAFFILNVIFLLLFFGLFCLSEAFRRYSIIFRAMGPPTFYHGSNVTLTHPARPALTLTPRFFIRQRARLGTSAGRSPECTWRTGVARTRVV